VIISEFLADNVGGLVDEDNESQDWIEIYNSGTTTVNLAGWHLTDSAANLTKWTFPSTPLLPKGFLIVFASGKDRAVSGAPLHANFTLDANGEYLALVKPDGVSIATAFAPRFPSQRANFSYGIGQTVTVNRLLAVNQPARIFVPTNGSLGSTWAT